MQFDKMNIYKQGQHKTIYEPANEVEYILHFSEEVLEGVDVAPLYNEVSTRLMTIVAKAGVETQLIRQETSYDQIAKRLDMVPFDMIVYSEPTAYNRYIANGYDDSVVKDDEMLEIECRAIVGDQVFDYLYEMGAQTMMALDQWADEKGIAIKSASLRFGQENGVYKLGDELTTRNCVFVGNSGEVLSITELATYLD